MGQGDPETGGARGSRPLSIGVPPGLARAKPTLAHRAARVVDLDLAAVELGEGLQLRVVAVAPVRALAPHLIFHEQNWISG